MERHTVHLFCGIGIFVSLLYSDEASSASQSILDVMKKDQNLCDTASFLYNSNSMSNCGKFEYPKENVPLKPETAEIFLCLGVYDACYKICHNPNKGQNQFNSTVTFDSYIKTLSSGKDAVQRDIFCPHIRNITPVYEKTKPFVSLLKERFNTYTRACTSICINWDETLNPLCAILFWTESMGENVKKPTAPFQNSLDVVDSSKKTNDNLMAKKPLQTSDPTKPVKEELKDNNSDVKKVNESPEGLNSKEQTTMEKKKGSDLSESINKLTNVQQETLQTSHDASTKDLSVKQTDHLYSEKTEKANNIPYSETSMKTGFTNVKNRQDLEDSKTTEQPVLNPKNDLVDDEKISTTFENTHSRYNTVNQDDYGHLKEASEFDTDDAAEQTADTGDQSQNIREPPEQRETLPRYHSMKTEEASHILTYFIVVSLGCIAGYIGYHNKQKILAIVLEGRRTRSNRGKRRPSTASYRKLDCTLEEAVTSQCNANVTHVIY